jgi:hypothetical protein
MSGCGSSLAWGQPSGSLRLFQRSPPREDEIVAAYSGVSLVGATLIYPFAEPGPQAEAVQAIAGKLPHSLRMEWHHDLELSHTRRLFQGVVL